MLDKRHKPKIQLVHAYSKLFYESKLKTVVNDRYEELVKNTPEGGEIPSKLAFRNKLIAELYEKEPQEVKEQVKAHKKVLKERKNTTSLDVLAQETPEWETLTEEQQKGRYTEAMLNERVQ